MVALNFDDLLGTVLIGTWVCSMLYAVILRETWSYFKNYPRDSLGLKLLVAVTVLCDTIALAATYATVYLYTVSHWGDLNYLTRQYWPLYTLAISGGISAALVQGFLMARYYLLTRNRLCTLFVFVLIAFTLTTSIAGTLIIAMSPDYAERYKSRVATTAWFASSAATDIVISLALIWQFYKMKTSFPGVESMIKRLITRTIQTGSSSSIIAVCTLIFFLRNNSSNAETMTGSILPQVYVITLFANVNMREKQQNDDISFIHEQLRAPHVNSSISLDISQMFQTVVSLQDEQSKAAPTHVDPKSIKGEEFSSTVV
ncbi:hypothetical protein GYMLUDRAFT_75909 [Collybiopsis luxurians FD-317 M1]|uniref:DUF6534 domain-containing protein n=1 Tax=Collybiopsis luxurians FD-317 M1 TaxID=944289 RepID=A0A0D0C3A6_9AGAR|nr:hypothetical protein GYMLUDRAFT_75909 [Collybiopsis luxurians FD-317 M1]